MNFAFFSDLDDTLLDHQTYDFEAARPGIELLKRNDIPLVLMTSKTEEETLEFVERLGIEEAFSIENGGAAFIPRRYLSETEEKSLAKSESYMRIALGMRFAEIRAFFEDFQERQGAPFCSLTDLSPEEVFRLTGLPGDQAAKALARAYDLPFTAGSDAEEDLRRLAEEASPRGLTVVKGGRFYHLKGTADKGTSYDVLRPYYFRPLGSLRTVGLGDSLAAYRCFSFL